MSDETMQRELDAVDDALATGTALAVDPVERELRALAVALQADAPTPDPAFARELRARVEAGFPRERRLPGAGLLPAPRSGAGTRSQRGSGLRALLSPAGLGASAVAAVLIALVVAVSIGGSDRSTLSRSDGGPFDTGAVGDGAGAAESAPSPDAASGGGAVEPDMATIAPDEPPSRGGDFTPGREQRIARSAALTLAAPGDELGRLADRVTAVTDRHRGFVLESSVTAGEGADAGGSLQLRIPDDRLRAALRDLSALASVRSSTQAGEDVTGRFVSARDRLAAAKAERVSLLERLENAQSDTQADALRARLDLVAGEINGLRGQLRELRLRTSYAAVAVTLEPDSDDGAAAPGSTEDALDDSLGILQGALNVAVRVAAVILPFALVGGAAWWTAAVLRRRRRESALGA